MKPVTIGYLPFQDIPGAIQNYGLNSAEKSFELAFKAIPDRINDGELSHCDVVFLRTEVSRWEWLEVLLRLNRMNPGIPTIILVPEGSIKGGCSTMRTVPSVILVDNPESLGQVIHRWIEPKPISPKRVLFVDDDRNILDSYKHAFFKTPLKILTASSARMALEILSTEAMDLVVTDIKMPGMHGLELIEQIRKIDQLLPIIVCSGYRGLREDRDMYFYKVSAFMEKPMEIKVLEQKILDMLDTRGVDLPAFGETKGLVVAEYPEK